MSISTSTAASAAGLAALEERLRGLPIQVVHGALDWMFPVDMAREAVRALDAAGADVAYQELPDLAHAYPLEMSAEILAWLT